MTTKPLSHTAHDSGVPAPEYSVEARVVTITGAAQGIGRELGRLVESGAASVLFVPKEKCTRKLLRVAVDPPQCRASSHCT